MRISTERLKERLQTVDFRSRGRKYARFAEALAARLDKTEYGPDGLLYACDETLKDPANDFDRRDAHEILRRFAGDGDDYFVHFHAFTEDFREAVDLWLKSPNR